MKSLIKFLSPCLIVITGTTVVLSKDWRGITPLHSTRTDVERRLGSPANRSSFGLYYSLADEIVFIRVQNQSCDGTVGKFGIGWDVPIDTVTEIGIIPKGNLKKDQFVNAKDFKTEDANAGFVYFTNEKDGVSVEIYKGIVTLITYSPPSSEANHRCPRLQNCCIDFFPKFDEYALLAFNDEKARLDNFVIRMRQTMGRGALVIFGENAAGRKRLLKRAQSSKRYLVGERGLEAQRLLIIDGGYRDHSVTELHLYLIDGELDRIYLFPEKDPSTKLKN